MDLGLLENHINELQFEEFIITYRNTINGERVFAIKQQFSGSVYTSPSGDPEELDGWFEYEPSPSNRDETFLARTRFTLPVAIKITAKLLGEKNGK